MDYSGQMASYVCVLNRDTWVSESKFDTEILQSAL